MIGTEIFLIAFSWTMRANDRVCSVSLRTSPLPKLRLRAPARTPFLQDSGKGSLRCPSHHNVVSCRKIPERHGRKVTSRPDLQFPQRQLLQDP